VLAAVLAALLLASCSVLLPARTFTVVIEGEGNLQPVTVQLVDETGTVTGIALAEPGFVPAPDVIQAVDGQPNAVAIGWVGGACDRQVDIEFRANTIPTFTVATRVADGACDLMGVLRGVVITFRGPAEVDRMMIVLDR
jgi:hypothetical protein